MDDGFVQKLAVPPSVVVNPFFQAQVSDTRSSSPPQSQCSNDKSTTSQVQRTEHCPFVTCLQQLEVERVVPGVGGYPSEMSLSNSLVSDLLPVASDVVVNPLCRRRYSSQRSPLDLSSNSTPQSRLTPLTDPRTPSNPLSYPDLGSCDDNGRKRKWMDAVDEFSGEFLSQNSATVMKRGRFDSTTECQT